MRRHFTGVESGASRGDALRSGQYHARVHLWVLTQPVDSCEAHLPAGRQVKSSRPGSKEPKDKLVEKDKRVCASLACSACGRTELARKAVFGWLGAADPRSSSSERVSCASPRARSVRSFAACAEWALPLAYAASNAKSSTKSAATARPTRTECVMTRIWPRATRSPLV